jgi:hypothetical protein
MLSLILGERQWLVQDTAAPGVHTQWRFAHEFSVASTIGG